MTFFACGFNSGSVHFMGCILDISIKHPLSKPNIDLLLSIPKNDENLNKKLFKVAHLYMIDYNFNTILTE